MAKKEKQTIDPEEAGTLEDVLGADDPLVATTVSKNVTIDDLLGEVKTKPVPVNVVIGVPATETRSKFGAEPDWEE